MFSMYMKNKDIAMKIVLNADILLKINNLSVY